MLLEQSTRRPSLKPLERSLLRYRAALIILIFFFSQPLWVRYELVLILLASL